MPVAAVKGNITTRNAMMSFVRILNGIDTPDERHFAEDKPRATWHGRHLRIPSKLLTLSIADNLQIASHAI